MNGEQMTSSALFADNGVQIGSSVTRLTRRAETFLIDHSMIFHVGLFIQIQLTLIDQRTTESLKNNVVELQRRRKETSSPLFEWEIHNQTYHNPRQNKSPDQWQNFTIQKVLRARTKESKIFTRHPSDIWAFLPEDDRWID